MSLRYSYISGGVCADFTHPFNLPTSDSVHPRPGLIHCVDGKEYTDRYVKLCRQYAMPLDRSKHGLARNAIAKGVVAPDDSEWLMRSYGVRPEAGLCEVTRSVQDERKYGPSDDGYCYLHLIEEEYWSAATKRLGSTPRFGLLLTLPRGWLNLSRASEIGVVWLTPTQIHLTSADLSVTLASLLEQCCYFSQLVAVTSLDLVMSIKHKGWTVGGSMPEPIKARDSMPYRFDGRSVIQDTCASVMFLIGDERDCSSVAHPAQTDIVDRVASLDNNFGFGACVDLYAGDSVFVGCARYDLTETTRVVMRGALKNMAFRLAAQSLPVSDVTYPEFVDLMRDKSLIFDRVRADCGEPPLAVIPGSCELVGDDDYFSRVYHEATRTYVVSRREKCDVRALFAYQQSVSVRFMSHLPDVENNFLARKLVYCVGDVSVQSAVGMAYPHQSIGGDLGSYEFVEPMITVLLPGSVLDCRGRQVFVSEDTLFVVYGMVDCSIATNNAVRFVPLRCYLDYVWYYDLLGSTLRAQGDGDLIDVRLRDHVLWEDYVRGAQVYTVVGQSSQLSAMYSMLDDRMRT